MKKQYIEISPDESLCVLTDVTNINSKISVFAAEYLHLFNVPDRLVAFLSSYDNFKIDVKNGLDKIKPMLRFTNSYDGSNKTSGHFGLKDRYLFSGFQNDRLRLCVHL